MEPAILNLDPGEKGIVGKMVVENTTGVPIELSVEGDGPVLRDQQIIRAEDAVTPGLRLYYMVMSMYIDPDTFEEAYKPFLEMSRELVSAVPSTSVIIAEIGAGLFEGDFRGAYEMCFQLLKYEEQLAKTIEDKAKENP